MFFYRHFLQYTGLIKSMKWAVYFSKYELYNKMSLTKVFLLIILHFLAYSLFLCVNATQWKRNFFLNDNQVN
jgi:hypothetical protein